MNFIINENQLHKLLEIGGGVHSDGQIDLFLEPEEINSFRDNGNKKIEQTLIKIEKQCGWTHNPKNDIDKGDCILHKCYPIEGSYENRPVPRSEFMNILLDRMPEKYLKIDFSMELNRPKDWYVNVIIKKV